MAGVYTERLLLVTVANTWVTYTVPAGKRAVVMTVSSANAGTGSSTNQVALAGWTIFAASVPASGSAITVNMRLAAYAGETIQGRVTVTGATIIVSGYLFDVSALAYDVGKDTVIDGPEPEPYASSSG